MPTPWWYAEPGAYSVPNPNPYGSTHGGYPTQVGPPPDPLAVLRENLVGELQAITQYEAHARTTPHPRVRAALLHIAQDEKQHVAELMTLIAALDQAQAMEFARSRHV